ncbi:MAG: hypothetical protein R8N23_14110 [Reichenbachiella sp.]|uniref:hypothetical protein n=1 Tax=Reichenbachiella sp. TaxID=2184521 RepID=UPI002966DB6F|nr:hypothetical protein [Reichenbachiella sp.]MDW3211006.1 hypothetical protein [Reichenbachiella sp.]
MDNHCKSNLIGLIIFLLVVPKIVFGQTREEDQEKFNESIQWLESNLAYVYQNPSTGKWWHNNFLYNAEKQSINVKNSSSDTPNRVDKGLYFDRIVNLRDLDLASIRIEEVKSNKGRVVKGKVVHIDAIGKTQRIQKLYNGAPSFKEFFLQFPFPKSDEDFSERAEDCKRHFETVIRLASEVYPAEDSLKNTNYIFDLIPGTFKGSDNSTCEIVDIFPHSMELRFKRDGKLYKKSVISYDEHNHHFIYWMVNAAGSSHFELNLHYETEIFLEANSKDYRFNFPNSNHFSILDRGTTINYHRTGFNE